MQDFTRGPVARQLLKFSLPMLIGNLFQQFYSMADAAVVGRYVGGEALAAVGACMAIFNLLLAVLFGLTTGASVLISQFYGAGQHDALRRTVSTSIVCMGAFGLVLCIGSWLGAPQFLQWLNVPETVFPDALSYLRIGIAGCMFPLFYNMYTAYLRALGDSRYPLYILIFCTALNVGLDLLFVVRFHLGVAGAAYATILSQALSTLWCYLYAKRSMPLLHVSKLVFDGKLCRSLLQYSVPSAVQFSLVSVAGLSIQSLVNGFGAVAMAGFSAALRVDSFAMMPVANLSSAVSTFVGQNMGAGQEARAKRGLYVTLCLSVGLAVATSLLVLLFGQQMIGAFLKPDDPQRAAILQVGTSYLSVIVMFYVLFGVFFSFTGFFRGVGDALIVMILTITSLSLRAVISQLLSRYMGLGVEAIAWSIPIGWGLCSAFSWLYYKRRWWAGKLARTVQKNAEDGA